MTVDGRRMTGAERSRRHSFYNFILFMEQKNNPLHGKTLLMVLEHLVEVYRWEGLAYHIDVNCFKANPSIKSSLIFLRKTPWARQKVEELYLKSL
jgi:uncharacterized protein (DUF2132 family)